MAESWECCPPEEELEEGGEPARAQQATVGPPPKASDDGGSEEPYCPYPPWGYKCLQGWVPEGKVGLWEVSEVTIRVNVSDLTDRETARSLLDFVDTPIRDVRWKAPSLALERWLQTRALA